MYEHKALPGYLTAELDKQLVIPAVGSVYR
jgi:hypothetical protein